MIIIAIIFLGLIVVTSYGAWADTYYGPGNDKEGKHGDIE